MSREWATNGLWPPVHVCASITHRGLGAELGGPVLSKLEGELFGPPVEQLWVLCQQVGKIQTHRLLQIRPIHQRVEGLQDWEKPEQAISMDRETLVKTAVAAHSRTPLYLLRTPKEIP